MQSQNSSLKGALPSRPSSRTATLSSEDRLGNRKIHGIANRLTDLSSQYMVQNLSTEARGKLLNKLITLF